VIDPQDAIEEQDGDNNLTSWGKAPAGGRQHPAGRHLCLGAYVGPVWWLEVQAAVQAPGVACDLWCGDLAPLMTDETSRKFNDGSTNHLVLIAVSAGRVVDVWRRTSKIT
jgi:hypothetical protein